MGAPSGEEGAQEKDPPAVTGRSGCSDGWTSRLTWVERRTFSPQKSKKGEPMPDNRSLRADLRRALPTVLCALLALGTAAALSACGTARPKDPPENLACGLVKNDLIVEDSFVRVFTSSQARLRPMGAPKPPFTVLSLSAGGEFGAYGAGFLGGWAAAGPKAVPVARSNVQVVTGVSTGSMIATHAFLGEEATVEKIFRELSGEDVYAERSKLSLLTANSLLKADGKDHIIAMFITPDVVQRVVEKSENGTRGLYIGVVDLDTGQFLRIDMVKLAKTIEPASLRLDCFRAILGASAAIPIAFPPKFVDGRMLVDGGARRHLFFTDLGAVARDPDVTKNVISFVHGDLAVGAEKPVDNGVLQIAGRMAEVFTDQGLKESIVMQEILATSCLVGVGLGCSTDASKPASPARTFYAAAAAAAKTCAPEKAKCTPATSGLNSEDMFCNAFMKCLADRGKEDGLAMASGAKPWLTLRDLNLSSQPRPERAQVRRKLLQ